jgi:hypothetical protein
MSVQFTRFDENDDLEYKRSELQKMNQYIMDHLPLRDELKQEFLEMCKAEEGSHCSNLENKTSLKTTAK